MARILDLSGTRHRLVVFGLAVLEDVYGTARIKVPNRPKVDHPDGLDLKSADDVFRLYWRYCEPVTMQTWSSTTRKLPASNTHVDKIMSMLIQRHCTHLVMDQRKKNSPWVKELLEQVKLRGIEVVRLVPDNSIPPGLNPDECSYFEKQAWQLVYTFLRSLKWPETSNQLELWKPVGQGKDTSAAHTEQKRVREMKAARMPSTEELRQLTEGEIHADEFYASGVRLERAGRAAVANAQEMAIFNERGIWKESMLVDGQLVPKPKPRGKK